MSLIKIEQPRRPTRVVVFGADEAGARIWETLSAVPVVEVVLFVDNDARKHGSQLCGVEVGGTNQLKAIDHDLVLIAGPDHLAVVDQLIRMGLSQRRLLVVRQPEHVEAQLAGRGVPVRRQPRGTLTVADGSARSVA
jgi:FlaA1/EpsC-like NDP-sugar epimerase